MEESSGEKSDAYSNLGLQSIGLTRREFIPLPEAAIKNYSFLQYNSCRE